MSDNDDLKKQLEVIQKQLDVIRKEMRHEILENRLSTEKAVMRILEGQLTDTQRTTQQLRWDIEREKKQSIMTDFALYFSIVTSASVGFLGNWFVSLLFQPRTQDNVNSLIISGFFLVITIGYYVYELTRTLRQLKKL